MPRDRLILAAQGVLAVYVLYQVGSSVYNHLKAKDRLKCKCSIPASIRIDILLSLFVTSSDQITLQRQCRLID